MRSKLDPLVPSEWHDYYRQAERRRRQAGWHRRGDSSPPKRGLDANRVLALVMGVALVTVLLCLAIPS